jgi:hypothetical protein
MAALNWNGARRVCFVGPSDLEGVDLSERTAVREHLFGTTLRVDKVPLMPIAEFSPLAFLDIMRQAGDASVPVLSPV